MMMITARKCFDMKGSGMASAADLKFLHQAPRGRIRNFKSKSGTRNIKLLATLCFRSSCQRCRRFTNFGNGALVICLFNALEARRSHLLGPEQAPGRSDHLGQACGQTEIAERVWREPPEIVEFLVQHRLAGTPARRK